MYNPNVSPADVGMTSPSIDSASAAPVEVAPAQGLGLSRIEGARS